MINIYLDDKPISFVNDEISVCEIKKRIYERTGLESNSTYALYNGKLVQDEDLITNGNVRFITKVLGGKGGFGSMLRAIGAQIEKTTNREACRDLSGRRLRDINEEKRLKAWINNQSDREQEAAERKQQKIQRLCSKPKHEFRDKNYDEERSQMTENVADAVEAGFQSTSGTSGNQKRKSDGPKKTVAKKKSRLWIDADEEDLSLSDDSSSDEAENSRATSSENDIDTQEASNSNDASSDTSSIKEAPKETRVSDKIAVNAAC